MTWFRTGRNTCPLCNNEGVNIQDATWCDKLRALENYKTLRRHARSKNAPQKLKRAVKSLIKIERKRLEYRKKKKDIMNSTLSETGREFLLRFGKLNREGWRINRLIRRKKIIIGLSAKITNIIIPVRALINEQSN